MDDDRVERVRSGYDRLAPRYDEWAASVTPDLRPERSRWIVEHTPPGGRVLELGCGTGIPVAAIVAPARDYVGIDLSPGMLALARERVPAGSFRVADMRSVAFSNDDFDAVIALYSIIHVPLADQPGVFANVFRWLVPGGSFVVSLAPGEDIDGIDEDWLGVGPMHWESPGEDAYLDIAHEQGFVIEEHTVISQHEGAEPADFLWLTLRKPT